MVERNVIKNRINKFVISKNTLRLFDANCVCQGKLSKQSLEIEIFREASVGQFVVEFFSFSCHSFSSN
jgi:hypothetical protein